MLRLQQADSIEDLYEIVVDEMQRLSGFDRVMLYLFDKDWHGDVVAEQCSDRVPNSYMGLHFPASDIPKIARDLYEKNPLRLIADIQALQVQLIPAAPKPLDLSQAVLRGVSKVHVEYLGYMGVDASMSVSVFKDDKLHGLIACHHYSTKFVPHHVRMACEFLGQIMSLQLSLRLKNQSKFFMMQLEGLHSRLLAEVSRKQDIAVSYEAIDEEVRELLQADGCCVIMDGQRTTYGKVPQTEHLNLIVSFLKKYFKDSKTYHFVTDQLSALLPEARAFAGEVSGLLAVRFSLQRQGFMIWFRPEVMQAIEWGGKPEKWVIEEEQGARFSPRKSFELWRENIHLKSIDWSADEIEMALNLRRIVLDALIIKTENLHKENQKLEGLVQERTKELSKLNEQMQTEIQQRKATQENLRKGLEALARSNEELESFAYIASHDMQEPLRVTSSFAQLLARRYADQLDEQANKYINFIVDGTSRMQQFVKDLLNYSRIGRGEESFKKVNVNKVMDSVVSGLDVLINETDTTINYKNLPVLTGKEPYLLRLFQNLISNAIKYRSPERKPVINVSCHNNKGHWQFCVEDNGIGIDASYLKQVFVIFKRLHTSKEYSGTGIGLSICQKIVEQHGGAIWAESEPGSGSRFYFTLSKDVTALSIPLYDFSKQP